MSEDQEGAPSGDSSAEVAACVPVAAVLDSDRVCDSLAPSGASEDPFGLVRVHAWVGWTRIPGVGIRPGCTSSVMAAAVGAVTP